VSITSALFRAARLSATGRALTAGPAPTLKRFVRILIGRTLARTGIFRWPR
jgi:hypothetical protein